MKLVRFLAFAVLLGPAAASVRDLVAITPSANDIAAGSFAHGDELVVIKPDETLDSETLPLVILLHDKCGDAGSVEADLPIKDFVDEKRFRLAVPSASRTRWCQSCPAPTWGCRYGARAWDAWPACCHTDSSEDWEPNDLTFLQDVVALIGQTYSVDTRRLYFAGIGAGGMMTYRIACEWASDIAGIFVFGGAMPINGMDECLAFNSGTDSTHVLHVHGEEDRLVPFAGGPLTAQFASVSSNSSGEASPSAMAGAAQSIAMWAAHSGCDVDSSKEVDLNLVREPWPRRQASDTVAYRVEEGCAEGSSVELWSIKDVGHSSGNIDTSSLAEAAVLFFLAHEKPLPSPPPSPPPGPSPPPPMLPPATPIQEESSPSPPPPPPPPSPSPPPAILPNITEEEEKRVGSDASEVVVGEVQESDVTEPEDQEPEVTVQALTGPDQIEEEPEKIQDVPKTNETSAMSLNDTETEMENMEKSTNGSEAKEWWDAAKVESGASSVTLLASAFALFLVAL